MNGEMPKQDDVYELPALGAEIPVAWQSTAAYALEQAVRCPHCRAAIRTVRVVRMVRSQAPFTSTLPRGGRAMVCPECDRIISMELSAL